MLSSGDRVRRAQPGLASSWRAAEALILVASRLRSWKVAIVFRQFGVNRVLSRSVSVGDIVPLFVKRVFGLVFGELLRNGYRQGGNAPNLDDLGVRDKPRHLDHFFLPRQSARGFRAHQVAAGAAPFF